MAEDILIQSVAIDLEDPEETGASIFALCEINENDNNGKTSGFYSNEPARIRYFSDSDLFQSAFSSFGNARLEKSSQPHMTKEFIVFNNESEKRLSYPVRASSIFYSWQGKQNGHVTIENSTVKVSAGPVTGVLKIEYRSYYDLYSVSPGGISELTKSIFTVTQGENIASTEIEFIPRPEEENEVSQINDPAASTSTSNFESSSMLEQASTPYYLTVKDYSTGAIVPGAEVIVNGVYKGLTDAQGKIFLGNLAAGNYSLVIRKQGYFDSQSDDLNNDSFTVT